VPGGSISQHYHGGHLALDIAASAGSTVVAADAGVVTWAGWRNNGGGYVVMIDHGNGIVTGYNHLSAIWVSAGQAVARGQGIAGVGCTGICTGPHLHFQVIVGGVAVNPLRYL
jgi:murein DD-endopeptidase MepM/ murein hydrolase activator NlpD